MIKDEDIAADMSPAGPTPTGNVRRGAAICLTLLGLTPLCPHRAEAQQSVHDALADWFNQDTMTGNWGGIRTSLEDAGVKLRGHFVTETAYNPTGGKFSAGRYTQQFDFGADLDLNRLVGIPNAKFEITLTYRSGRSLSDDALGGGLFPVQELYGAGNNMRVATLAYEQSYLHEMFNMKIGFYPLGDNFGRDPIYCHFTNGAVCGHPKSLSQNGGWHNFPTAQWGAMVQYRPLPDYYVQTGIYQNNPYAGNHDAGFDLSFRGSGVVVPFEVGWEPKHGIGGMPGAFRVGGYYDSAQTSDVLEDVNGLSAGLTGAPFLQRNGRWSVYTLAKQTVYQEPSNTKRGLTLFGMATASDPETSKYRYFFSAGAVYQGTFPGRDNDYVGFEASYTRVNNRLASFQEDRNTVSGHDKGVQKYESVIEVDYGAQLCKWLNLRPNVQYVIHPGATGKVPDALVLGLYTSLSF
jgi:porin